MPQTAKQSSPTASQATTDTGTVKTTGAEYVTAEPGKHRGRTSREEREAKRERATQADFLVGCTIEERAYCIRLVRIIREKNYWISELVRHILDRDARQPKQITIKQLRVMLDNFDTIEALADNAQRLGNDWSNHPVMRAIRKEWEYDEIKDYVGDRRIERLIESAHKK